MSKKNLLTPLATLLVIAASAYGATSKIEISIGGPSTEFPEASKGFLVVDTAGDGFDFIKSNELLKNQSESVTGSFWGNNDVVVLANLKTVEFPGVGRGFNIPPKELDASKAVNTWKSGDKVALVWFTQGASAIGSPYSYYTSNRIENSSGTNAFEIPQEGSTDSIVVTLESKNIEKGIIASNLERQQVNEQVGFEQITSKYDKPKSKKKLKKKSKKKSKKNKKGV
jgi:hypothetical protein